MNPVTAKQVALDNSLVLPEKRLKIEKCNARIEFSKPQREETYQVTSDALKLSPCYPAFLITAKVLEVYMHQFWNTIQKIKDTDVYRFKLDKKKCRIDTEELCYSVKCDMLSAIHTDKMHQPWRTFAAIINRINLHTVYDGTLLGTLKFFSKTQDDQQYGALIPSEMINQDIKDSKAYKTYLDFATGKATPKKARKFKKVASPLRKLSPVLEEEPAEKPKLAKKPAKKYTTMQRAGVVIRDTPSESVPKNKTPTKVDRGKGVDFSNVALIKAAQLKKTLKKSKLETHKLHASSSCDGVGSQPKVPDEQEDKTAGTDEGTGDSGDDESNDDDSDEVIKDDDDDDVDSDADGDKEASDSKKTHSDEDENPNLNQNDDEEEEQEEEYVRTPDSIEFTDDDEEYEELYKDVNVRLQATEHEEEGKRDEEMTDAGRDEGTQHTIYEQVKDDEHVRHEEPSTQTSPLLNIPVTV
ncbi:hypothetical protein Tco_1378626 [Tanacetum coccineum]